MILHHVAIGGDGLVALDSVAELHLDEDGMDNVVVKEELFDVSQLVYPHGLIDPIP